METGRAVTAVASTALVIAYAVGSGRWVGTGDSWYRQLRRPPWQPPDAVFGVIWPYNFAALIAAGIAVATAGSVPVRIAWLSLLAASITSALAWARLFYVSHRLWPAAAALVLAAVLTVPLVAAAFRARWWAGVISVPYAVWLALASSLAVGYAQRN